MVLYFAMPRICLLHVCSVCFLETIDLATRKGSDSLVIEATGTEEKVNGLLAVLRPFGVLEMVRTGRVAMARGQQSVATETTGGAPEAAPEDNVSHSV